MKGPLQEAADAVTSVSVAYDHLTPVETSQLIGGKRDPEDFLALCIPAIAFQAQAMGPDGTLQCFVLFQFPAGSLEMQEHSGQIALMPDEAKIKAIGQQLGRAIGIEEGNKAGPPPPLVRLLMRKDALSSGVKEAIGLSQPMSANQNRVNIPPVEK